MYDPTSVDPPAPAAPPASTLRKLMLGLGGFAFWPMFAVVFGGTPACMGFEEPTLRTLEACPDVAAALGTPIHRSWLGMSCGNAETSDSFGNASWSFPVEGPSGRGSVDVVAERRGGPWMIYSATVETDRGTVEAVSCARSAGFSADGMPGAGPATSPRTFAATVSTAAGPAPAAAGASCEVHVGPGAGPFPCQVVVTCGGTEVYGSPTGGYLGCSADAGGHLVAMDTNPSAAGGDPMLTLTAAAGTAVITDTTAAGTWTVTLAFPPF
jgi:hypothetical protein